MNRILVPTDFSDLSLHALSYAIKLFEGSALELTILHTYDVTSSAFHMKSMDRIMEDDAQKEMDALLKKIQKENPDISLKHKIVKGNAVSIITSLGNGGVYDFIIMGTKGAKGLKEVFIGSVAGGVISKTKAPVIVVPGNYDYRPLNEVVFAISGMPLSDDSILEPLRKLVTMSSANINVLHIAEDIKPDLEEVISKIKDLNPSINYAFGTGNINQRLSDYIQNEDADLVCLIRSKRDFFNRLFNESVTLKQTFNSSVPLLILQE